MARASRAPRTDLIWMGAVPPPEWPLGDTISCSSTPRAVHDLTQRYPCSEVAEYLLFWDAKFGAPNERVIARATSLRGHLWHAGLRLGMAGLPRVLDFVAPTWMFARDPDSSIEATSWRLSLRACLISTEVLRRMGGPHASFVTLEGASLEFGHRCIRNGAITRHVPWLIPKGIEWPAISLPLEDELRFLRERYDRRWLRWAIGRAVSTGYADVAGAIRAWRAVRGDASPSTVQPLEPATQPTTRPPEPSVSALIPTLERYPYLRKLLGQLRDQTVAPLEIIVVDQTPATRRCESLAQEFPDLPLRLIYLDEAGQSTARNAGLEGARGDYVLFLDDDVELEPTVIERHLETIEHFCADASSGSVDEVGALPTRTSIQSLSLSDSFPTNNTLARKSAVTGAGGFDPVFDRGQRADHDLGMRMYLAGALLILNPACNVFHHHAANGGLRAHGARVITYSSSRQRIRHRHLATVSEIYLAKKYYTDRQVQEALCLRALGTLSLRGSVLKRTTKAGFGLLLLPLTWREMKNRAKAAERLMDEGSRFHSTDRPHILHVIDSLSPGGAERMCVEIANATDKGRYRVSVCATRSGKGLDGMLEPGVHRLFVDRRFTLDLARLRPMAQFCMKENVLILHVHGRSSLNLIALMRVMRRLPRRIVLVAHDHYGDIEIRPCLPLSFRVSARLLKAVYVGVHPALQRLAASGVMGCKKTFMVENAIDFSAYATRTRRVGGSNRESCLRGIMVANLRPSKDVTLLLRSLASLKEYRWAVTLLGSTRNKEYVRTCIQLATELGIEDRIAVVGSGLDVPKALSEADFAVLASKSESGPVALLEYAAAALPFVATRVGSIGRRLETLGVPGFVSPGDHEEMAVALKDLLSLTDEQRRERGIAGRRRALEHFEIRNVMPRWYAIYTEAMSMR